MELALNPVREWLVICSYQRPYRTFEPSLYPCLHVTLWCYTLVFTVGPSLWSWVRLGDFVHWQPAQHCALLWKAAQPCTCLSVPTWFSCVLWSKDVVSSAISSYHQVLMATESSDDSLYYFVVSRMPFANHSKGPHTCTRNFIWQPTASSEHYLSPM